MRIAYVLSGTGLHDGSTKAFLHFLRPVLETGHQVLVICPNTKGVFKALSKAKSNHLTVVSWSYENDAWPSIATLRDKVLFLPRIIRKLSKNYLANKRALEYCQRYHPDIVHSNTSVNDLGWKLAQKLRIPHIWHIREYGDLDFNIRIRKAKEKLRSSGSNKLIITKDVRNHKGLDHDSTAHVVYDGVVSQKDFRYNDTPSDYFLYAGRLTEGKGVFDLLEAYALYTSKRKGKILSLKLAGSVMESVRERIKDFIISRELQDKVEILGARDDINELMFNAKAVVVPSICEGFGFVLPEAMANGTLTIGRDTGGTHEQYENGLELTKDEIGIRFLHVEELADILEEVSSTPKLKYRGMIERSQQAVRLLYTVDGTANQILQLYERLVANHSAR